MEELSEKALQCLKIIFNCPKSTDELVRGYLDELVVITLTGNSLVFYKEGVEELLERGFIESLSFLPNPIYVTSEKAWMYAKRNRHRIW